MTAARIARAEAYLAERIARWSAAMGCGIVPDAGLCTERAALLGLPPPGRISANGSCRLIRARDGWLAVNLPRPEDATLVPALLGAEVEGEAWQILEHALPQYAAAEVLAQARLLGMAVTRIAETPKPVATEALSSPPRALSRVPRVVDLSALWAGPLCAGLLARAGCAVSKVETLQRPDTTATRAPAFDRRLNGAKRRWRMDRDRPGDRARLRSELAAADVVVTNARPRALGWLPNLLPARCIWIAIRAHAAADDRIGFGDDCAAAGGLLDWSGDGPRFAGDAVADPLTGLAAAALAFRALATGATGKHDIALATVAAWAAHV